MGSTRQVSDNPSHPYTRALLRCLPDVALKRQQLVEIGGQPPDLARLPPGCPFAPRCPERQAVCDEAFPATVNVGLGHTASCWAVPAKTPARGEARGDRAQEILPGHLELFDERQSRIGQDARRRERPGG